MQVGLLPGVGDERAPQHVGGDVADDVVPDAGNEQHGVFEVFEQSRAGGSAAGQGVGDALARVASQSVAAAGAGVKAQVRLVGFAQSAEQLADLGGVTGGDAREDLGEEGVQQVSALLARVALQEPEGPGVQEHADVVVDVDVDEVERRLGAAQMVVLADPGHGSSI